MNLFIWIRIHIKVRIKCSDFSAHFYLILNCKKVVVLSKLQNYTPTHMVSLKQFFLDIDSFFNFIEHFFVSSLTTSAVHAMKDILCLLVKVGWI